ncbi:S41 family peptidase [Flavobacterium silvaticum]|uniref:S41 family peptidase n=1 Tax=Flavobacterium silvaticum TaxID=1852020 RepID=A0A972FM64_9FLAO|nr:S41 family peptidase [Flavobacterium silvaticum]NMH27775.1 S41 family peptidase [Flavobacterium silvaticum]
MNKNLKYLPILLFATLALGILIGGMLNLGRNNFSGKTAAQKNKLDRLLDFIDHEYVENVNTDSIVDLTVNNILSNLDPHSVYLPKDEQEVAAQTMKGDFVGIGVNFYMYRDSVAVIMPVKNGPSDKAGIQPGDRILYAGNKKLFGRKLPNDSLFSALKGNPGSDVELTVFRKSDHKTFKVNVKRGTVPIKSVDVAVMLNATTGYIKINRFAETTYDEFKSAFAKLRQSGMREMVIDLRDNGGGYLEMAVEIADDLLKDGQLIVFTKNKKGRIDKTFATGNGSFENGKVTILVNENSASASEILAGAIQDNDRGNIVGRRSFGKGLVQREMGFDDGSAVRLTIAKYYTPTGRSIQKPYDHGNEEYFKEFDHRFESGELYEKDSIHVADSLKFKTPKGKIVYGGGGIVPDVFVPLEVEHGSEGIVYLMQSGAVSYFVFEQLDGRRNEFRGMAFPQFLQVMDKTDLYYNNFRDYVQKNGLDLEFDNNKALVKKYITAEFARQLYGDDRYYDIVLQTDPMIKAALKN